MSFCSNCGNELKENDQFCSNCGKKKGETVETVTPNEAKPVLKCFTIFGNVGHALGIVTFISAFIPIFGFYAIVPGVHGIVFSILGKRDEKQIKKCSRGLVFSIIGSIVGFVFTFIFMYLMIEVFE